MVYTIRVHVAGGCREKGDPEGNKVGGACAVLEFPTGRTHVWARRIQPNSRPTSERADLTAIIVAFEGALDRYNRLNPQPELDLVIYSDSEYAVGCMNSWITLWEENGWRSMSGEPVANADLVQKVTSLERRVANRGTVSYRYLPRNTNEHANVALNRVLDDMTK